MYFGWYPLSNARDSCVIPRSSRSVIKTRAKARFSRYARSSDVPRRAISVEIVAHISVWFHKLYYPLTGSRFDRKTLGSGSALDGKLVQPETPSPSFAIPLRENEGGLLLMGRGFGQEDGQAELRLKPALEDVQVAEGAPTQKGRETGQGLTPGALCMSEYFTLGKWGLGQFATDLESWKAPRPYRQSYPLYMAPGSA